MALKLTVIEAEDVRAKGYVALLTFIQFLEAIFVVAS
jgi:hypothetical protein